MNLKTINLSTLAEMIDATETEARSFRAYLLAEGITDTDELTDDQWADLLTAWEAEQAA